MSIHTPYARPVDALIDSYIQRRSHRLDPHILQQIDMRDLLAAEKRGLMLIAVLGESRAALLLNAIVDRIKRRGDRDNPWRASDDYLYESPMEKAWIYAIKLGLVLHQKEANTPYAAQQRLLKRIQLRRAAAQEKHRFAAAAASEHGLQP